jgi:hypothetical protein
MKNRKNRKMKKMKKKRTDPHKAFFPFLAPFLFFSFLEIFLHLLQMTLSRAPIVARGIPLIHRAALQRSRPLVHPKPLWTLPKKKKEKEKEKEQKKKGIQNCSCKIFNLSWMVDPHLL